MSRKRPLPPVSYYRSANGSLVRNHREHRRHKAYAWYLFETADVAVVDGKVVACQSKSFLDWRHGPFTPLTGTYHKPHVQVPIQGVVVGVITANPAFRAGAL